MNIHIPVEAKQQDMFDDKDAKLHYIGTLILILYQYSHHKNYIEHFFLLKAAHRPCQQEVYLYDELLARTKCSAALWSVRCKIRIYVHCT